MMQGWLKANKVSKYIPELEIDENCPLCRAPIYVYIEGNLIFNEKCPEGCYNHVTDLEMSDFMLDW